MIEVHRDARGKYMSATYTTADCELVPMLTDEAAIYARRNGSKELAQRKCICRICGEDIGKGQKRIAFAFFDEMIGRAGRYIPAYLHAEECKTQ